MKKSNIKTRKKALLAMEFLARQINDESVFEGWLMCGVADGDIDYGEWNIETIANDDYYLENENFAEIMEEFLIVMSRAKKSGGLYCDGIISKQ